MREARTLKVALLVVFVSDGAAARGPAPGPTRPIGTCPVPYVEPGPSKASCTSLTLVDEFDDGIIERSVREVYSQHGRLTRVFTDIGNDGVDDEFEGRIYNASGQLLSVKYDLDLDGTFDIVMSNEYAEGGLVHTETTYNGVLLSELVFTPGTCGPAAAEVYGPGGVLEQTGVYTWSPTSMVVDLFEAGSTSPHSRYTQIFDAATGRTEYFEQDLLALPGVEEWNDNHYDPSTGLLASVTQDGPAEILYFYDANLRLAEELYDAGLLVRRTTQWTCP